MININTIYNEDCLATMRKMPDNYVDLTVTSPPYDNMRKYDNFSFDFHSVAQELYRITQQGGVVVWVVGDQTKNGSESGTSFKQALYFKETVGFKLYDTMIYRKSNPTPLNHKRYAQAFEYMFVFSKGNPKTVNLLKEPCKGAGRKHKRNSNFWNQKTQDYSKARWGDTTGDFKPLTNIWSYPIGVQGFNPFKHPAVFPPDLARDHVASWSNENDLVYDPFLGSGTTALIAQELGRSYIGSEMSEKYFNECYIRLEEAKQDKSNKIKQLELSFEE